MNKRVTKLMLDGMSQKELKQLLAEVQLRLEPDTSDFDEADWEDVDRMRADGTDRLGALREARKNRDEAIADGDIEP